MKDVRSKRRQTSRKKKRERVEFLKSVSRSEAIPLRLEGKAKKTHFGCGCILCKPWKHGKESPLKPSERRKVSSAEEE